MPVFAFSAADAVEAMNVVLEAISSIIWHEYTLYAILFIGILFTIWSGFCQYRAMTHGIQVVRGKYDDKSDPGAINHFQALSAALSATVGIGNIGGVAGAIAVGGPGAVFWMWVVGVIGMALKTVECTLAMLYRNTDDPDNPHGGAMWVAERGLARYDLKSVGRVIGIIFCITLLISTITGGNMAQAYNVAEATHKSFGVAEWVSGTVLALLCGMVIIGGIKVIGRVAAFIVPFMCVAYVAAGIAVLIANIQVIPETFSLIFRSAFGTAESSGAFIGGTMGYAFSWGMKRAFFSNEAGQGSAPIAHSAAKTDEPVREGLVAGIGPFIDTIVVCTITSLVILSSGAWNRDAEGHFPANAGPKLTIVKKTTEANQQEMVLTSEPTILPKRIKTHWDASGTWTVGEEVFVLVKGYENADTGHKIQRFHGVVAKTKDKKSYQVVWEPSNDFKQLPQLVRDADGYPIYMHYVASSLTSHAFNRVFPGLGDWLIPVAVWFFALSTVISWSYYGEQGIVYIFGDRWVQLYRFLYCGIILLATVGFITTERELANLTDLGTGVMLLANLPICLLFGRQTMGAYHDYIRRLRAGEFKRQ